MNHYPKAERMYCGGGGKAFVSHIEKFGLKSDCKECDIAVIGEKKTDHSVSDAGIVFCPTDCLPSGIRCVSAVSAGMDSRATLGFSSVGDETSFLCVNREIDFFGKKIIPGEYRVIMKHGVSLYENMILGFLDIFL